MPPSKNLYVLPLQAHVSLVAVYSLFTLSDVSEVLWNVLQGQETWSGRVLMA